MTFAPRCLCFLFILTRSFLADACWHFLSEFYYSIIYGARNYKIYAFDWQGLWYAFYFARFKDDLEMRYYFWNDLKTRKRKAINVLAIILHVGVKKRRKTVNRSTRGNRPGSKPSCLSDFPFPNFCSLFHFVQLHLAICKSDACDANSASLPPE